MFKEPNKSIWRTITERLLYARICARSQDTNEQAIAPGHEHLCSSEGNRSIHNNRLRHMLSWKDYRMLWEHK